MARAVVEEIEDVKGEDILLLDLREITMIADYFVICTGNSDRQLKAIIERIRTNIKQDYSIFPVSIEGSNQSGWALLDYGGVVIHVFSEELRHYYDLEELWQEGKVLLRIQ
ncbi:ribosome silencing factor [Chloroflexota bacterium]